MLLFIRHGQSRANLERVFAGPHLYAPLTARGEGQARAVGREILERHVRIDAIVSSPIERALRTAEIISALIGIDDDDIRVDARLGEYDMGRLSGQSMIGVTPAQKVSAPGAEDPVVFQERVKAAVAAAALLPGTTLIVSHAGVGRMIEATKLGMNPVRFYEVEGYPNAELVKLEL